MALDALKFSQSESPYVVYSFGIGEDLSFSAALLDKLPVVIYAFDPTPRAIQYVAQSETGKSPRFHFYPYGLSNVDGQQIFYMPKNEQYVSCSTHRQAFVGDNEIEVEMRTFGTITKMLGHSTIDILKMDIEGSEFDVMDDILSSNVNIRQICFEVHDTLFLDGTAMIRLKSIIDTLHSHQYYLAKAKWNVNELTFVKVDDVN